MTGMKRSPRVTARKAAGVFTCDQTTSAGASRTVERSTIAMYLECEQSSDYSTRIFHTHLMPDARTDARKSPRQERSRRTVERILDAATRIFQECGYSGATTNDIADEASVSIGSLYQYFPNKDALLVALTRRHIESTTAGLADFLNRSSSDVGFELILRNVVDFLVAQHEFDHLHLLVMHEAPRTHEISVELDRAKSQLVDLTMQLLINRIENSHQRTLIARMVVATIDASVHDVILRQPKGKRRNTAVDLAIATALSIIEAS
jgi:AcrR family transcriptional regulator